MKKFVILFLSTVAVALLWFQQSREQQRLDHENQWLSTLTNDLSRRITLANEHLETHRDRPSRLNDQLDTLQKALGAAQSHSLDKGLIPEPLPDPRQLGGWPEKTDYLYFSKHHLANVDYKLLAGDRLTEQAALLMGMSSEESEAVNRSFSNLLGRFGQLEIESMEQVDPAANWGIDDLAEVEFSLSSRIPDLQEAIQEERQLFTQQMEQILGPSRAALMADASDTYLRQNVDDLGSGERTVGFFWESSGDGTHSIWYGISGEQYGTGTYHRISEDYDPDSQMAYYARLFGVTLPGQ